MTPAMPRADSCRSPFPDKGSPFSDRIGRAVSVGTGGRMRARLRRLGARPARAQRVLARRRIGALLGDHRGGPADSTLRAKRCGSARSRRSATPPSARAWAARSSSASGSRSRTAATTSRDGLDPRRARPVVRRRGTRPAHRRGLQAGPEVGPGAQVAGETGRSEELLLVNRTSQGLLMQTLTSLVVLAIIIDMIWKPGA